MALRLLARARRAVFSLISSLLKFFASAILVAVVAVVAVLAMPHLHSWAQTLSGAAQLASSLMYNTCTSHTCRLILLGSPVSSGIAAVLTVRQAWAWLNKDKKRIAMLEQTIRQLRADKNSLSFQVS
jgi:TRAP-type C4-dicarboxylate transport system permease small subunit